MPYKDKEKERIHKKLWREKNRERIREQQRLYYQENKRAYSLRAKKNYGKRKLVRATLRHNLKVEVLTHYGNGKLQCVICNETQLPCLSIDHIINGGTQHRRQLGKLGWKFYSWLKSQGYPNGYQTLCMNCQFVKKAQTELIVGALTTPHQSAQNGKEGVFRRLCKDFLLKLSKFRLSR